MVKLEGEIPSPINPPPGCKFQTRCRYAIDICHKEEPKLDHLGIEHDVACHRWQELVDEPEAPITDPAQGPARALTDKQVNPYNIDRKI